MSIKYPTSSNYSGGSVILNGHTSLANMNMWCPLELMDEVDDLILKGCTVFVHKGEIVAVDR